MDYFYKCKKCGQQFTYKIANHSIEVIVNGKKMLRACRGEVYQFREYPISDVTLEEFVKRGTKKSENELAKIPIIKNEI